MPTVAPATCTASTGSHPCAARRPVRWWLAGLLVGCLLPAGLAQVEGRPVERIAQICFLAPSLIRATSRLRARRRVPGQGLSRHGPPSRQRSDASPGMPLRRRLTAALDVQNRRGPPAARAR